MEGARKKARFKRVAEGIYERNGSFYAPFYEDGRKQMGPQYAAQREAEQARVDRRHRQQLHRQGEEAVDAFFERWVRDYGQSRAEQTNLHNQERVRRFAEQFKGRTLSSISRQEARAWALENRARVPAVRAMFSDALKDGFASENPFAGLGLRKESEDDDVMRLTADELGALVVTAEKLLGDYGVFTFGPLIIVAAYSGLRPGELFALRRPDIVWDRSRLIVGRQWHSKLKRFEKTKTKRSREVPLLPEAAAALQKVPAPHDESEPIFRTKRGSPLIQRTHHYYWAPVRAAFWASLPAARQEEIPADFDFYELRHYFGYYLAHTLGASAFDIAKALGHKDGGQTAMRHYIRTHEDDANERILERAREHQLAAAVTDSVTHARKTA